MHIIIWEYQVKPDKQAEFERIYSPKGAWAELFNEGAGYLGTELIHSTEHPTHYLTIDRWDSVEAYESFLSQRKDAYEKLDARCETFTEHENCVGRYLPVHS